MISSGVLATQTDLRVILMHWLQANLYILYEISVSSPQPPSHAASRQLHSCPHAQSRIAMWDPGGAARRGHDAARGAARRGQEASARSDRANLFVSWPRWGVVPEHRLLETRHIEYFVGVWRQRCWLTTWPAWGYTGLETSIHFLENYICQFLYRLSTVKLQKCQTK